MPNPIESVIHAFMMSTGDLEPVWETVEYTSHNSELYIIIQINKQYFIYTYTYNNIEIFKNIRNMCLPNYKLKYSCLPMSTKLN